MVEFQFLPVFVHFPLFLAFTVPISLTKSTAHCPSLYIDSLFQFTIFFWNWHVFYSLFTDRRSQWRGWECHHHHFRRIHQNYPSLCPFPFAFNFFIVLATLSNQKKYRNIRFHLLPPFPYLSSSVYWCFSNTRISIRSNEIWIVELTSLNYWRRIPIFIVIVTSGWNRRPESKSIRSDGRRDASGWCL